MTNPIVSVLVSQIAAPTPNTLQKMGAAISQGGTTLATNATSLITQLSDLTAILKPALSVTGIVQSAGTATATTAVAHGVATSATFLTTIAGATPAAYNGTVLATSTGASTFTYAVPSATASPATGTITYTPRNVAELQAMANTFFAQGSSQAFYVLELGAGEPAAGVTALSAYITAQPSQPFYAYLVPAAWDAVASFLTFLAGFEALTSKTYFFVTTTTGNYSSYTTLMKDVFWGIPAPTTPTTEFTVAGPFYDLLNYSPSTTNKVTPFAYTYQFGVTTYPTVGNGATLTAIQAANGNIVGTGAEGGISNQILLWGTTADGHDFSYWYSVDWTQINVDLALSNAVINGSNNPSNPLYLNQVGLDRLQDVAVATMNSGVSYGLIFGNVISTTDDQTTFNTRVNNGEFAGQAVVNFVPFQSYYAASPSDYSIGKYAGVTIAYTPNRGFKTIVVNLIISSFVAS
jgi:hypothetical protein